ncbi:nucleoid-associated protein [Phenylobacterium sp.]|uniref:nucleoid-associated protein n=1 Tax=Phenylobacterium sp. TaxID=1871053 RepID=UPI00260C39E2|nr:nucleoid-associated protein [Phenylobacterium sp.]
MILHVVGDENFEPEPERDVEHAEFFISRILDTDLDSVYEFNDESETKRRIERIARNEEGFQDAAQRLSREFSRLHIGATREGAFFIFELETGHIQSKIYSLIKYDYREAIEQSDGEDGSLLRRIVQAFIADKKAIQKSALIRIVDGEADTAVSARDRARAAPLIGDYFEAFLDVSRVRSDNALNQAVVEVVRTTLQECRELLPGQDAARAFAHAKDTLRSRQRIDAEAISDALLAAAGDPQAEDVRLDLERRLNRKLKSARLEGLSFPPDPRVLRRPALREVRTTEGVTIRYPDAAGDGTVRRASRPGGGEIFTIETQRVTEDRLVSERPRDVG